MIETDPQVAASGQVVRFVKLPRIETGQRPGHGSRIEQDSERIEDDGQLITFHPHPDIFRKTGAEQQSPLRIPDSETARCYIYRCTKLHSTTIVLQR